ncbi:hypothetical protein GCM10009839_12620 [Catenulispora yoronensis]|uniref:Rv2525c-like glycoside hydrolase-like domain-containing protein n=1 Tax=Catenulispora yoronensis TaxID=450799 RepID=A0ABP5F5X5_9ACTN
MALAAGTALPAVGAVDPEPVTVSTAYSGPGFDPCWAPSNSEMDAWLQSPYRAIGVYLGGPRYATGCRAENSQNLTPSWVHRQAAKGWRFLPIYVGSQAWYPSGGTDVKAKDADKPKGNAKNTPPKAKPGAMAKKPTAQKPTAQKPTGVKPAGVKPAGQKPGDQKAAADPAAADQPHLSDFDGLSTDAAYARALTEADDAVRLASGLGFPAGSVLYYDMEGYPGTYRTQVLAYSRGWTAELHRLGYRSGWYSSSDSGIRDLSRVYGADSPDVVDIANWNGADTVDDPSVQSTQWNNHQRVHQSDGDRQETWGGVTLSIDRDWIDVGTANRGTVERLAGWDRDATAAAVSQRAFDCAGCATLGRDQARSAVLSRDDGYADALGGAALAAQSGGPLLLTPTARLGDAATAELRRILAPGATVYLLGGPDALSQPVEDGVRAAGFVPVRIAGHDRYQTAVQIAQTISRGLMPSSILVVSGSDFHDALAASAAAGTLGTTEARAEQADGVLPASASASPTAAQPARHGAVVVLTDGTKMPPATAAYLDPVDPRATKLYAIGGGAATALPAAHRTWRPAADFTAITAPTHAATAVAVAERFVSQPTKAVITYGHDWPDALSGSAVAAHWNAPLLYTDRDEIPRSTESYLSAKTRPITTEVLIGSEQDIAPKTATLIGNAMAPSGLWDSTIPAPPAIDSGHAR